MLTSRLCTWLRCLSLTPLDAQDETLDHAGKELLAQAKRVAEKFSRPLSTELLRAREVGEAIVGVAKEQGVELLVMGHHKPHPHTLSETLLGGTVRYVAHHAPCRVIVQIPAPEHAVTRVRDAVAAAPPVGTQA